MFSKVCLAPVISWSWTCSRCPVCPSVSSHPRPSGDQPPAARLQAEVGTPTHRQLAPGPLAITTIIATISITIIIIIIITVKLNRMSQGCWCRLLFYEINLNNRCQIATGYLGYLETWREYVDLIVEHRNNWTLHRDAIKTAKFVPTLTFSVCLPPPPHFST